MRRDLGPLFLLLLLAVLASYAWLTRHPDAAIVRRAEGWPYIGPLAARFREAYLPREASSRGRRPEPPDMLEARGTDVSREAPGAAPAAASPLPAGKRETIWVLPGAVLRGAPSRAAAAILEFTSVAAATRLERRGDWFRVRYAGAEGWVYLEGYDESGGPPYGEAPEPPRALAPQPPDEAALSAARRFLGERERSLRLGPYALYTDCRDAELITYLDALAAQLEEVYSGRYGRRPLGVPQAALVLYRSELPYRILQRESERLADLRPAGHAAAGLAVLYVGRRGRREVGATLIHELMHLLNRRALGPALPPWLDEGLADDLAASRVDPDGRIRPRLLGGERREGEGRIAISGALASLLQLREALLAGRLPPLRDLLELDWEGFVRTEGPSLHYDASSFWIRYLLEAEGGRRADALRRYLEGVSAGEPASAERLREVLGEEWEVLEEGFRAWVGAEVERAGLGDWPESGSSSRQVDSPPA